MSDKIFAVLGMALFLSLLGVFAAFINELNLWIVTIVVATMALIDFWRTAFARRNGNNNGDRKN